LALHALHAATFAFAEVAVPPLRTRVTDLTATLSAEQVAMLEQTLAALEKRKGSQVAVLFVPTTQPESVEQYAVRVEENWKLGRKGVDDGVLLLIAKNDRKVRIEVGYGLEGALNDATAKRIIANDITPRLMQGDFYGGITAGVGRIINVIDHESLPPKKSDEEPDEKFDLGHALGSAIGLFFLGTMLFVIFRRNINSSPSTFNVYDGTMHKVDGTKKYSEWSLVPKEKKSTARTEYDGYGDSGGASARGGNGTSTGKDEVTGGGGMSGGGGASGNW
jgi:uncharacterized protein